MGLGTELLLVLLLAFLVLGPRQMHIVLGRAARAKIVLDKATREFNSQLTTELEAPPRNLKQETPT